MSTILVIDDMAIFRDPIAASLRLAGYSTLCARDGREALDAMRAQQPDLILLDLAMPIMDGLQFLRLLRANLATANVPVVVLSALSDRQRVVEAAQLGAGDYLLKSRFSMGELLERIKRRLGTEGRKPEPPDSRQEPGDERQNAEDRRPQEPEARNPGAGDTSCSTAEIPRLLVREVSLQRAENAMQAKTLSGVVAQVISLSASPRGDLTQLAGLIARDPMLSARVLQAANSAAYVSSRGVVATIPEAVRHIGCATIRNLAAALGIFDAMPTTEPDGFNPIRCWQHSFAVATLCERLAASTDAEHAPTAYLVGLCHELGEILFHTQFHKEYKQVLEMQRQTGRLREELERRMLGISQGELVQTILRCIGLPEIIREPIEQFHGLSRRTKMLPLTRVLQLAASYANGILLASSSRSVVRPTLRKDCLAAVGKEDPACPDATLFRSEILGLTAALARLSPSEEAALMKPICQATEARIWIARHVMLSKFDPVTAAMQSLGEAEVYPRLPQNVAELGDRALVVLAPTPSAPGFDGDEIRRLGLPAERILWLVGRSDRSSQDDLHPVQWPVPLDDLARFASVNAHLPVLKREVA